MGSVVYMMKNCPTWKIELRRNSSGIELMLSQKLSYHQCMLTILTATMLSSADKRV